MINKSRYIKIVDVSTRSRPKAAGETYGIVGRIRACFNTQPPEGGWKANVKALLGDTFQHAAARRRLADLLKRLLFYRSFNTQPPEGGWNIKPSAPCSIARFNTQPPEGGWKPP